MNVSKFCMSALFAVSMVCGGRLAAEVPVENGDAIAFLGDSITQLGNREGGYVNMTIEGLKAAGIEARKIPAGVSGHKSNNMLMRLDKDVISKKPQFMVLSCGVNDVWHQFMKPPAGVSLEDYKKNITEIVDRAQAAGIQVVIMTSTMIQENPADERNVKLANYNDFLRELAAAKGCTLVDQNRAMRDLIALFRKHFPEQNSNFVTVDGVHMNPAGNKMMALALLKGFGLNADQLAKAEQAINAMSIPQTVSISVADYELLNERALKEKTSVNHYAGGLLKEAMKK